MLKQHLRTFEKLSVESKLEVLEDGVDGALFLGEGGLQVTNLPVVENHVAVERSQQGQMPSIGAIGRLVYGYLPLILDHQVGKPLIELVVLVLQSQYGFCKHASLRLTSTSFLSTFKLLFSLASWRLLCFKAKISTLR